jgi:hypothetical protein
MAAHYNANLSNWIRRVDAIRGDAHVRVGLNSKSEIAPSLHTLCRPLHSSDGFYLQRMGHALVACDGPPYYGRVAADKTRRSFFRPMPSVRHPSRFDNL